MKFKIILVLVFFYAGLVSAADAPPVEQSLGEYKVNIYSDGSGYFGRPSEMAVVDNHWSFYGRDEMTDKLQNEAYRMGQFESMGRTFTAPLGLKVIVNSKAAQKICVVGHDFPGRTAMFRVDSNQAITTNTSGCALLTKQIDRQLRGGKVAKVQGVEWPDGADKIAVVNLDGYAELTDWLRNRR
jgi:hypothetical protein